MTSRFAASPASLLALLTVLISIPDKASAQAPPPDGQLWSAVSTMEVLSAARSCSSEPGCTSFAAPDGLVVDPATGQPLLSVRAKGAMDVGPLLDWAAATPGVVLDSKLVHVFDMTGHEVDISMDLLDTDAWEGLRAAAVLVAQEAWVSLHGVPSLADGLHPDLAAAHVEILACGGDPDCLQALRQAWPWLDAELGIGALHIEAPHDGSQHDAIVAELESLDWAEPPWVFAIDHADGGHRTRAVGRITSTQLDSLQAWLGGRSWSASTRPLTEDELSMVRVRLGVAEAAADVAACDGDVSCHHGTGLLHQAVVSPAGRLGVLFFGEDPDVEGLNGLEYPGWSMAPPGYFMDGAAGLLSFEALRDVGLGRWNLGEALSLGLDGNMEAMPPGLADYEAAWGPDDAPCGWSGDDDDSAGGDDDDAAPDDDDTTSSDPEPEPVVTASWFAPQHEAPTCPDAAIGAFAPLPPTAPITSMPSTTTPGWTDFLQPAFPPPVRPGGDGMTFFADYLHCRAALAAGVPDPDWCHGVVTAVPADFQDIFEVAKGTPLQTLPWPVRVEWADAVDPALTHEGEIIHQSFEPSAVQLSAEFLSRWLVSIESDLLAEQTFLTVEGYVDVGGLGMLNLEYVELVDNVPGNSWFEHATVPRWVWRFFARYAIDFDPAATDPLESLPWSYLGIEFVQPVFFGGETPGSLVEAVEVLSGPPVQPSLAPDDRAAHVVVAMGELVSHTISPYLQASEHSLGPHLVTSAIQSNPVVTGAPPWSWEILALDAVELYDDSYDHPSCMLSSIPGDQLVGLAPIVRASPAHPTAPTDIPVAEPSTPGAFHSIELTDVHAQGVSMALGTSNPLGIANFEDSFSMPGPALPGGEKRNVLRRSRLISLFDRLVDGVLEWTMAEDPAAYDCQGPADDLRQACIQAGLGTYDECTGSHWIPAVDVCNAGRTLALQEVEYVPPAFPDGVTCMSVQGAGRGLGGSSVTAGAFGTPGCNHEPPWWETDPDTGTVTLHLSECALVTVPLWASINFTTASPAGAEAPPAECPSDIPMGTLRSELAPRMVPLPYDMGVWESVTEDVLPLASLDAEVETEMTFAVTAHYAIPMWMHGLDHYSSSLGCLLLNPSDTLWSWEEIDPWLDEMAGEIEASCFTALTVAGLPIPEVQYTLQVEAAALDPTVTAWFLSLRGGFPSAAWIIHLLDAVPIAIPLDVEVALPGIDLPEEWTQGLSSNMGALSSMTEELAQTLPLASLSRLDLQALGLLARNPAAGGMPELLTPQLLQAGPEALTPLMLALRTGNSFQTDCEDEFNEDYVAGCGNYLEGSLPGQGPANPNIFVGSQHFLAERIGLFDAGGPTRAAAVRETLDLACDTVSSAGAGSCSNHVIVSLAGEQDLGVDGAIWLFRPDPALSSGWQPGRLP